MLGLSFDEDEDNSSYDIIYLDKYGEEALILGEVAMPDEVSSWGFWMISSNDQVTQLYSAVLTTNPRGQITLNAQLPGFNFAGVPFIKLGLRYGKSQREPSDDWCVKCDERGEFIRTALVCPNCDALLGGC